MSSNGKVAIVTGAGSGIGKAVALALLKDGYSVALAGRRADALEADRQGGRAGGHARAGRADRRDQARVGARAVREDEGEVRPARRALQQRRHRTRPAIPLEELTFEQWKTVVDINLTGAFLCTQEAFKLMKAQTPRGGRIINNGSISAHAPRPNSSPYTVDQARDHRPHQVDLARRPQVRHRLRPDRHRQRAHRDDRSGWRRACRRRTARSRSSR